MGDQISQFLQTIPWDKLVVVGNDFPVAHGDSLYNRETGKADYLLTFAAFCLFAIDLGGWGGFGLFL